MEKNAKEGEEIRTWSIVWRRKGWLRSREARQGAFSLAATKRRRFSPPLFLSLSFSFLFFPLRPPLLVEIPRGAHSIIRYLCRTRQERPVARKATVQETLTPFRSSSPVTLPHPSSPLPLIAVLPRPTSQTLRFFPRVTRFRSQNPIPRLNIYCPLRLINDTFLHPATS